MFNSEIVEAIKEFVRMMIIAVVPNLIASLSEGAVNWQVLGMSLVIAVLRALDRWAHTEGIKSPLDLKGLDILEK